MTHEDQLKLRILAFCAEFDRSATEIDTKTDFTSKLAWSVRSGINKSGFWDVITNQANPAFTTYHITPSGVNELNRLKEQQRVEAVALEKLEHETKLVKLQTKYFWPALLIGMIGGILGIISFFWHPYN